MKNLKLITLTMLIIFIIFFISPAVETNRCSLCAVTIPAGDKCFTCILSGYISNLKHPCQICGKRIFFGKICQECRQNLITPSPKTPGINNFEVPIEKNKDFEITDASKETTIDNQKSTEAKIRQDNDSMLNKILN
ncbi:MAG: hypothetical protein QMC67_08985 [Candidatus Wallbacteria bacterium]